VRAQQVLADYSRWLQRQALAARTCTSYRRWVGELVEHLLSTPATRSPLRCAPAALLVRLEHAGRSCAA
jgi:hypothetical protein